MCIAVIYSGHSRPCPNAKPKKNNTHYIGYPLHRNGKATIKFLVAHFFPKRKENPNNHTGRLSASKSCGGCPSEHVGISPRLRRTQRMQGTKNVLGYGDTLLPSQSTLYRCKQSFRRTESPRIVHDSVR